MLTNFAQNLTSYGLSSLVINQQHVKYQHNGKITCAKAVNLGFIHRTCAAFINTS
jgi:hypothetical protein